MLQITDISGNAGSETPLKLPRGTDIDSIGALIHHNISGTGVRKLDLKFRAKKAPRNYRIVKFYVKLIFAFIDANFQNGRLHVKGCRFPIFTFHLGDEWELDEKVIPVSKKYAIKNGYHSTKFKKSHLIYQAMVLNIFDRKTHFCIISMPVGRGTVKETKEVLRKAIKKAGKKPKIIYLDPSLTHKSLAKKGYLGIEFRLVEKIGIDISQVHIAEGYHKLMDRKLESGIHGYDPWLLKAIWIQYNLLEPKECLEDRTPAQVASDTASLFNTEMTWADLLGMAIRWHERKEEELQAKQAYVERQKSSTGYFDSLISTDIIVNPTDAGNETAVPAP